MLVSSALLQVAPSFAPDKGAGAAFPTPEAAPEASFDDIYEEHFAFVWRNIRRLGVPDAQVDDAVQEVFLVVSQRLGEFEGRAKLKTWIFRILLRVARDHRRTLRRKSPHAASADAPVDPDTLAHEGDSPHDRTEQSERARLVQKLFDELDDDKRVLLVLSELEQQTVPEIAEALGENLNTVYTRLRAARRDFEQLAARERARDGWRLR